MRTLWNRFIDFINDVGLLEWEAVTIMGQTVIPAGSAQLWHFDHIPMLAQGAVIPPNREFMAVLGDQKYGNNIETPEALLRQIVREESGERGDKEMTVILELDREQFGRLVYKYGSAESRRIGVRLAE